MKITGLKLLFSANISVIVTTKMWDIKTLQDYNHTISWFRRFSWYDVRTIPPSAKYLMSNVPWRKSFIARLTVFTGFEPLKTNPGDIKYNFKEMCLVNCTYKTNYAHSCTSPLYGVKSTGLNLWSRDYYHLQNYLKLLKVFVLPLYSHMTLYLQLNSQIMIMMAKLEGHYLNNVTLLLNGNISKMFSSSTLSYINKQDLPCITDNSILILG